MNESYQRQSNQRNREISVSFRTAGLAASLFLVAIAAVLSLNAQDSPTFKIDDDVSRFAFSATGRIAYAARHVFSEKKVQLQRDDIWIWEPDGKKRRILFGEKFIRGTGPFSYLVRGLQWSPDGTKLTIELAAIETINADGGTREGVMTLLLDNTGREIAITGGDSLIRGASSAEWLADGVSVVYLTELGKPSTESAAPAKQAGATLTNKLYVLNRARALSTEVKTLFPGHVFSEVAWSLKQDAGIAIEQKQGEPGPPTLVAVDPAQEALRPLAAIEGYASGLSISPSGKKVAYWINNEQLEVREIDSLNRMARVRVAIGSLAWSGDETRVLVKRGLAARSGGLVWVTLPPLAVVAAGAVPATTQVQPRSILHDLEFRQFDISPDGRFLAVVEPGKRNLLAYPLS